MIDLEQKAHDLTVALVGRTCNEATPEAFVKMYGELLPQVAAAIHAVQSPQTSEVKVTPRPF